MRFQYIAHKWIAFFLEMMQIAGMKMEILTYVLLSSWKYFKNYNHMFHYESRKKKRLAFDTFKALHLILLVQDSIFIFQRAVSVKILDNF